MPQTLLTQLERVSQRRCRRQWIAATGWAGAAILASGLTLVGLDRVLGIADPVGRVVLTAAFVASLVWIFGRWKQSVQGIAVTPLQVAHEVEQRYPAMRDTLASAWEFASQTDEEPTAGSESLRRAVVLRAATSLDEIDWETMVPRRPLRRSALAFGLAALTTCLISWLLPQAMATGVTRLINPLSAAEWPRDHNLEFVDPPQLLADGTDLVLQLHDTYGSLPEAVTMQYRTRRQGRWHEEVQPVAVTGEPQEIRRSNVRQSLQFRAIGGDHKTMSWHELKVIAPPRIEEMTITVHPPAYTELPAREWKQNATIFVGSELELRGRVDQPISQVSLVSESGTELLPTVEAEGREFVLNKSRWKVQRSGTYSLELTTRAGLTSRSTEQIALDVIADQPPTVRFLEPAEDLAVVSSVELPLVIEAKDELAVREVELVFRRSDRSDQGEQRISLWNSTANANEQSNLQLKTVEHLLNLKPWSLAPGSLVELHARACDAQPMTGQSVRTLRLKIMSEDQLWTQLIDQQAQIAVTLAQLLREQRELSELTSEWAVFPDWASSRWNSSAHAALFRQRRVADSLVTGHNSVSSQVNELLTSIRRNRLLRPAAVERLQAVQAELQALQEGPLVSVEDSLSEVTRQVRRSLDRKQLEPHVHKTETQQQEISTGLQSAIELLMPGNVLGRLERELAELESDQAAHLQHCQTEIASQLLRAGNQPKELGEVLAHGVRRQQALSRRLAELLRELSQAADRLADGEPVVAVRLAETVRLAEKLGMQSTIQAAADHLSERRLGNSTALQRTTLEHLAALRTRLAGQDSDGAAERLGQLQSTERELQRLRRNTAVLERQLERLSAEQRRRELERLRREREQLAQQADKLARQLEQLRVPQAAKPANEAGAQLRRGSLDHETTKQARKKLDEAQRALTSERRRQQVALAQLQMAQLDTKLKAFVGLQQTILLEIRRLDDLRIQSGQLSNPQQQSVRQVQGRQQNLREDIVAQAESLQSLPVFTYLLEQAADTMTRIEAQLIGFDLGPKTQSEAELAIAQLTQIVESVNQEQQKLADNNEAGGGSGGEQAGDTPQAQTLQLALGQLKLLKSLQDNLRVATEAMERAVAASNEPPQSAIELARQQQELTELAQQLVPEPVDPPAEEAMPNLDTELEKSFDDLLLPQQ